LLVELQDPRRCADATLLAQQVAPPAELRARLDDLREQIDSVALLANSQPRSASDKAIRLVAEARELGFTPALAEALALDAKIATRLFEHQRALVSTREAARLAKAIGDTRLEFHCLRSLVELTTKQLDDPERAADLLALMLGSFEQLGRPLDLLAEALFAESELAYLREDFASAELLRRRALEQRRAELDESDLRIDHVEIALANVLAEQGRLDEAVDIYEALLTRLRAMLGPIHPEVATVEFNLALTALESNAPALARKHVERALTIQRQVYGSDSAKIAPALVVLAQARAAEDDLEGALAAAREAWPLEQQLDPHNGERGNSLRFEAQLLNALERFDEALVFHEHLEAELGPGLSAAERAMINHTIGWLLCRVGEHERARFRFGAGQHSDNADVAARAQLGLAEVEFAANDLPQAAARLARALEQIERLAPGPLRDEPLGEARLLQLRLAAARGASAEEINERIEQVRRTYSTVTMPAFVSDGLRKFGAQPEGQ